MSERMQGQGIIEYTLIFVLVAIIIIVILAVFASIGVEPPTATDIYEQAYSDCIARETLTQEQCHDIALEAINSAMQERDGSTVIIPMATGN